MTELTIANAANWLAGSRFEELGGGVSNTVILVESPGTRSVLKQSRGRLRVEQEWLSDRNRVFRESAAMRWAQGRVRGGRVPRILLEDRENFVIGMEAAPPDAEMWKAQLFRRVFDALYAEAAGTMLGSLISSSWNDPEAQRLFGDQSVFRQLRIDPYYRFTAEAVPEFAPYLNRVMEHSAARAVSLVHGDWSPKNLLVSAGEMWAIDWEVIHFGDPSFDVAFLLNHLLLKSVVMPAHRVALCELAWAFNTALDRALPPDGGWITDAALEHLPALLLARVDGKSPAEYLDEEMRSRARSLAHSLLRSPAATITELFER